MHHVYVKYIRLLCLSYIIYELPSITMSGAVDIKLFSFKLCQKQIKSRKSAISKFKMKKEFQLCVFTSFPL